MLYIFKNMIPLLGHIPQLSVDWSESYHKEYYCSNDISLQLAIWSIKYLVGILEDVSLWMGHFIIPTNFVIMEMEEDAQIHILLQKSFIVSVGDVINVKHGKLTFVVGNKNIKFLLSKLMKSPTLNIFVVDST